MFLGLAWYWWLVIVAALIVSIPFKVKFMNLSMQNLPYGAENQEDGVRFYFSIPVTE